MNDSQLRAFHAVAITGSFTRAARKLHVSQPAVTQHVKALEERYEAELFLRTRQGAKLTELGLQLLELTSQRSDVEKAARNLLEEAGTELRGTLRIAADGPFHTIELLRRFRSKHPGVHVVLEVGNSTVIEEKLRSHQADVGVLADFHGLDGLVGASIGVEEIGIFVSSEHPWAARRSLRLEALHGVDLIRREEGSRTRAAFEIACERHGVAPNYVMELGSREAVREAVASGLGAGVVNFAEVGRDTRVSTVSFSNVTIQSEEFLIALTSRRQSRLISAFFAMAESDG